MATIVGEVEPKVLLQAHAHSWNIMYSFIKSMSLKCAVDLDIAEAIYKHGKPISLTQLVTDISLPAARKYYLRRQMRMLVELGIFAQCSTDDEEVFYDLTEISQLLIEEKEAKVSPFTVLMQDQTVLNPWHDLSNWFKSSDDDANKGNSFSAGMTNDSKFAAQLLIREGGEVFQGVTSLVDVGGGNGTTALEIEEAFPHIKCTVLDLPHVVEPLKGNPKVEAVGGDMFQHVPPANTVLLKWVLHLWSDDDCVKILQNCKKAIPSKENGGKIIIVDVAQKGDRVPPQAGDTQLLFDIYFVAHSTGRHRNQLEWEKIFTKAGFKDSKVTPFLGSQAIIEVFY